MKTKFILAVLLSSLVLAGCNKEPKKADVFDQLPQNNKSVKSDDTKKNVNSIFDQLPKTNNSIK